MHAAQNVAVGCATNRISLGFDRRELESDVDTHSATKPRRLLLPHTDLSCVDVMILIAANPVNLGVLGA
jgi:hypothetical protein